VINQTFDIRDYGRLKINRSSLDIKTGSFQGRNEPFGSFWSKSAEGWLIFSPFRLMGATDDVLRFRLAERQTGQQGNVRIYEPNG
jgi:hypothetical protein